MAAEPFAVYASGMVIETVKKVGPYFAEVVCTGPYSSAGFLAMLDEALDFAASNDRRAVLVDVFSLTGGPDTQERFDLAVSGAELQLAKAELVAVAIVGTEPMIDPGRFGETVAVNRCAVVGVFDDRDQAIEWLEHTSG